MAERAIDKERKTMGEYIDREAMLEDFESCNRSNPKWTPQRIKTLIVRQPPVDAVPVIRCKDCKYWSDRDGIYTTADGVRFARCRIHNNEHLSGLHEGWCPAESCYCSLGERKENINGNKNHKNR